VLTLSAFYMSDSHTCNVSELPIYAEAAQTAVTRLSSDSQFFYHFFCSNNYILQVKKPWQNGIILAGTQTVLKPP